MTTPRRRLIHVRLYADIQIGSLTEILDDSVVKLLALHEEMPAEEFWAEVERLAGDLVTTTWSSSFALFNECELSDKGDRLAYCSDVAERPIESSSDLTVAEARAVVVSLLADKEARS